MIEYGNYYYRIHKNLFYRIPNNIKTFKKDMKKEKLDPYFWSMEEIIKNWKKTIYKLKKWEPLIHKSLDYSSTFYSDWRVERHYSDWHSEMIYPN